MFTAFICYLKALLPLLLVVKYTKCVFTDRKYIHRFYLVQRFYVVEFTTDFTEICKSLP